MHEIRKFFSKGDFEALLDYAHEQTYGEQVNPVDNVPYPDISLNVPGWAVAHIEDRLSELLGRSLRANHAFFRLTTESSGPAPHQAHTDSSMGRFTFILYMQDGPGGTALVTHKKLNLSQDPWTNGELEVWKRDTNDYDAWRITRLFEMEANKGVCYPSKLMHRAEPVGGFGEGIEDGRLVLTAFLDVHHG